MEQVSQAAPDLAVRPARPEDMDAVENLFRDAIASMQAQGIDQWDEQYPDRDVMDADQAAGTLWIFEKSGELAVVVTLNEDAYCEYAKIPWRHAEVRPLLVHRLCVRADLQGRGIARSVMLWVERHASEQGYGAIRLDTFTENRSAIRLYEGLGYEYVAAMTARKGRFPCYEKRIGP